jgi:hypothetical protein
MKMSLKVNYENIRIRFRTKMSWIRNTALIKIKISAVPVIQRYGESSWELVGSGELRCCRGNGLRGGWTAERRQQRPRGGQTYTKPGLRIRIRTGSGFNQVSGSGSAFGIRMRIQEGKNDPQKQKKSRNFMF